MLRLIGTPAVLRDGQVAERLPDKVYALVCLLILKFSRVADRETIADLLWEDGPPAAARANLRNVLSQLSLWQNRNGVVLLQWDRKRVWRSPDCEASDLDEFLAVTAAPAWELLASFCQRFGDGLLLNVGSEFERDLTASIDEVRQVQRSRLLELVLPVAEKGGVTCEGLLRDLLRSAPIDDRIERALLTHLSRWKSRDAVRAEYRAFVRRYRSDLGEEPELETRLLAQTLGIGIAASPEEASVAPQTKRLPRVLVLPPIGDEYIKRSARVAAAGMVDDVVFSLCRLRTFEVVAPHTARRFVHDKAPMGTGHDVDYVVFTRLLPAQSEGEFDFAFGLVRAQSETILFGDKLRFRVEDVPARRADLAALVVSVVAQGIERQELTTFQLRQSPTAYVYFLHGQERLHSMDLPDLRAARRAFRHALDLAPDFAPAMSMIARTLTHEWLLLNRGDPELLAEAERTAKAAIERDPLDPAGYRELGNVALYSQDLDGSLEYTLQASERGPHHADVLLDRADSLAHNGRYPEAKRVVERARSLNPMGPDEYVWVAATIQFFLRDFRGALKLGLSMVNPEPLGRLLSAAAYLVGDRELSSHWRDRTMERHPDFRVADWGNIVPMRNTADVAFFKDAMRAAGFP